MPIYLNPYQPRRPAKHPETGETLLFRTYPRVSDEIPSSGMRVYQTTETINRVCQMILYRWCRSDDFVEAPGCADLHEYLYGAKRHPVSKRHLGMCIVNALNYECRKLKGVTKDNPKMKQLYFFHHREELQYGLEYMICAWLRKFLNDNMSPAERITVVGDDWDSARARVSDELDILVDTPYEDFLEVYVAPLFTPSGHRVDEPDWRTLLRETGKEEEIPLFQSASNPRPLRNYR